MRSLFRRDPSTFVLGFAAWAAVNGISLVLPSDAFDLTPIYSEVARFRIAEAWWGLGMLVDAGLLALTVAWGSAGLRASMAIASCPAWFAYGVLLLGGAAHAGLLSAAGAFDLFGALGLASAGAQWAHTLAPRPATLAAEDDSWI